LQLLSIHFKQAYDSINRTYFYEILKKCGIPKKSVNLIKMTLQVSNRKVQIQGQLTEAFGRESGLRQGDALSTTLFNTVLDK
jgi:hypothetical protein